MSVIPEIDLGIVLRQFVPVDTTNGVRTITRDSMQRLSEKSDAMAAFALACQRRFDTIVPTVVVTTSDMPASGQIILGDRGLPVVAAPDSTAKKISYADMLNKGSEQLGRLVVANISPSLANKPDIAALQLEALKQTYTRAEMGLHGSVTTVGSFIGEEHDMRLINTVIEDPEHPGIDATNLSLVFPTSSFALVDGQEGYSRDTDNGHFGTTEVDGKTLPIGGNELLHKNLTDMANGKNVFMVISPDYIGDRVKHQDTVAGKNVRRSPTVQYYVENSGHDIVKLVDEHLFFVRVSGDGDYQVALTARQRSKGIVAPTLTLS